MLLISNPLSTITVGSRLWGTDCPLSDTETLIIVPPSPDELFLGEPFRSEQKEGSSGTTTIWSTGKYLSLLLKGSPDAYAYLPTIRKGLTEPSTTVSKPLEHAWLLFCHKAYLQACKGSFKAFINAKTTLMCKQRVRALLESYNKGKDSFSAKDMFDLYFLTSKARQILTGWGWEESVTLLQLTNQTVVPVFSGALDNIESFKWFRENERDYRIWRDKEGELGLIEMAETLLDTEIEIKGGVDREVLKMLYMSVFVPELIKSIQP